ncbi:MAG: hypothetical protein H7Y32_11030, partial [Chloroflexales bacterium]|nr:hypothetical protein [Chloroflexales bacterium]
MKRTLLLRLCALIMLALTVGGTSWETAAAGVAAPAPAASSTLFLPLVQSAG